MKKGLNKSELYELFRSPQISGYLKEINWCANLCFWFVQHLIQLRQFLYITKSFDFRERSTCFFFKKNSFDRIQN